MMELQLEHLVGWLVGVATSGAGGGVWMLLAQELRRRRRSRLELRELRERVADLENLVESKSE